MKKFLLITLLTLGAGQALASNQLGPILISGVPLADSYCYSAVAQLVNNNIHFNWPFVGQNLAGQCTCEIYKALEEASCQGLAAIYANNPGLLPAGITPSDVAMCSIQVPKACSKVWNQ